MTIEEIRALKTKLEKDIAENLSLFEKATGLNITLVQIHQPINRDCIVGTNKQFEVKITLERI